MAEGAPIPVLEASIGTTAARQPEQGRCLWRPGDAAFRWCVLA